MARSLRGGLAFLPRSFFSGPADTVARSLLGRYLVRKLEGERLVLKIVETEAYLGEEDPASHSFGGRRTERTRPMYLAGGAAYVYLIYGMHHCMNVVTGREGEAGAVLLRAGEPIRGLKRMLCGRGLDERYGVGTVPAGAVAGGPGKLCAALAVDRAFSGTSLLRGDLRLAHGEPAREDEVEVGRRVGIDYAGEAVRWPLRFGIRGHRDVSKPPIVRP